MRITKHTGLLLVWFNQRRTVVGSYVECAAAISAAQLHNWAIGWWSVGSLLWNPISLRANANARKTLRQQAEQASAYSQWWATYYGVGYPHTKVWSPPPAPPARRKWWLWIPLGILGLIMALIVLIFIIALISVIINRINPAPKPNTYGQAGIEQVEARDWDTYRPALAASNVTWCPKVRAEHTSV